jgi:hypothetical protein
MREYPDPLPKLDQARTESLTNLATPEIRFFTLDMCQPSWKTWSLYEPQPAPSLLLSSPNPCPFKHSNSRIQPSKSLAFISLPRSDTRGIREYTYSCSNIQSSRQVVEKSESSAHHLTFLMSLLQPCTIERSRNDIDCGNQISLTKSLVCIDNETDSLCKGLSKENWRWLRLRARKLRSWSDRGKRTPVPALQDATRL